MSSALATWGDVVPDVHHLITEDDEPVDIIVGSHNDCLLKHFTVRGLAQAMNAPFSRRQMWESLYLARRPAIVPDMFLSLDDEVPENWWEKEHRSYFLWEFGKPPDLAIEIVSHREGEVDGEKRNKYARIGVRSYVIFDPLCRVMPEALTIYRLKDWDYEKQDSAYFPLLKLGLMLWDGVYEGKQTTWPRWVGENGQLILSGKEQAQEERQRAEQAELLLSQ